MNQVNKFSSSPNGLRNRCFFSYTSLHQNKKKRQWLITIWPILASFQKSSTSIKTCALSLKRVSFSNVYCFVETEASNIGPRVDLLNIFKWEHNAIKRQWHVWHQTNDVKYSNDCAYPFHCSAFSRGKSVESNRVISAKKSIVDPIARFWTNRNYSKQ